jgi:hypothetical protein
MTAYLDDPAAEFAALLSAQPASDPTDSIYERLEPADQFALVLHLAGGGRLGVPDGFEAGDSTQPDPDAPRAPRLDKSQGRRTTPLEADPAVAFGQRVIDALDGRPGRWRDL